MEAVCQQWSPAMGICWRWISRLWERVAGPRGKSAGDLILVSAHLPIFIMKTFMGVGHAGSSVCVWMSEDNIEESVPFLCYAGFRDSTPDVRLDSECPYPLSHPNSPSFHLLSAVLCFDLLSGFWGHEPHDNISSVWCHLPNKTSFLLLLFPFERFWERTLIGLVFLRCSPLGQSIMSRRTNDHNPSNWVRSKGWRGKDNQDQ